MAVPEYQTFMLPALRFAAAAPSGGTSMKALFAAVAADFKLSDEDLRQLLPSGSQTTFTNRVSWACSYLRQAGLLRSPKRAHVEATERGTEVLKSGVKRIDVAFLRKFPEFNSFQLKKGVRKSKTTEDEPDDASASVQRTPLELLESSFQKLRSELAAELLEKTKTSSPAFFERLVVELVVAMGYGGTRQDAGKAIGRSGDGGIDGIIKEDKLGLDAIFLQAKRWKDNSVGRPEIQQFAGALAGHGATKGIFITTSTFTEEANRYAESLRNAKIVLIDGEELAELMIDHGIGVSSSASYQVKRIDSDYFLDGED